MKKTFFLIFILFINNYTLAEEDLPLFFNEKSFIEIKEKLSTDLNFKDYQHLEDIMHYINEKEIKSDIEIDIYNILSSYFKTYKKYSIKKEISSIIKEKSRFLFDPNIGILKLKENEFTLNDIKIIIRPYKIINNDMKVFIDIYEEDNNIIINYNDGYIIIKNKKLNDEITSDFESLLNSIMLIFP